MALDSEGIVTVAKLQLNADGFLVSAGNALVIPYIDGNYDAFLFRTEAEADTDDINNAIQVADNITGVNGLLGADAAIATTLVLAKANVNIETGKAFIFSDRASGIFDTITGTGTANGFNIIAHSTLSLSFVLRDFNNDPRAWGLIANDLASAATNSPILQAYATYCLDNGLTQDYSHGTFFYDTTLDFTGNSNRTAILIGNNDDSNNVGIESLIYTGTGIAIDALAIKHTNFSLGGTDSVLDSIPVATTGIRAAESVQHTGSSIRNFNEGYDITGGFYHRFIGGRMNRCRTLWNYINNPSGIYNSTFQTQNTGFVNGIVANGGDGPIRIGGSWEEWTDDILSFTAGSPQYNIVLDSPYIENYPTRTVAAGLTGNDLDTYTAPRILNTSNSAISGNASIECAGVTVELILSSVNVPAMDLSLSLYGAATSPPLRLFNLAKSTDFDLKIDYTNSNFDAIPTFVGAIQQANSKGQVTLPDGTVDVFDGDGWNPITLLNSWANIAGSKPLSYKVVGNKMYIVGLMNGTAATNVIMGVIPTDLLSNIPESNNWFNVNTTSTANQGRLIQSTGDLRIETTGSTNMIVNTVIHLN